MSCISAPAPGRKELIAISFTTTGSTRAGTLRRGSSHSSLLRSSGRGSTHSADPGQQPSLGTACDTCLSDTAVPGRQVATDAHSMGPKEAYTRMTMTGVMGLAVLIAGSPLAQAQLQGAKHTDLLRQDL